MLSAPASPACHPNGLLKLNAAVEPPAVYDVLVVGGGPFGTAVAFRAKEQGLAALVIDYDDLMKRIRDYAKDKQILADFGGGDRMQFPVGGPLISALPFTAIDKDELCARWKDLYVQHSVPAQIGVEFLGLTRDEDVWIVKCWNHNTGADEQFRARHVVLGPGRGVPRKLEVTGELGGLAFALNDAARYVGHPALVIGGGTSAAEAVVAISRAKAAAADPSAVYWSHRGDKMPKVSKALAEVFFDAFMANGNVRYLPKSEPTAVVMNEGESWLCVRTERVIRVGEPVTTAHLEFRKAFCIACIGEDIPTALLSSLGIPLQSGGQSNAKRIVVSPLLEAGLPNVYVAGDVLSPSYFETGDFAADPSAFVEIKRRGNIKSALRDGVLIAEVIAQKLAGRAVIDVVLEAPPAPAPPEVVAAPIAAAVTAADLAPKAADASLVSILPSGIESTEFPLRPLAATTIGLHGCDIAFVDDARLAPLHATIRHSAQGYWLEATEGAVAMLRPAVDRTVLLQPNQMFRAGRQWFSVDGSSQPNSLVHHEPPAVRRIWDAGQPGLTVVGRESPGITVASGDKALSRRHFAVFASDGRVAVKDLGSANGLLISVREPIQLADGDVILVGQQLLRFADERKITRPTMAIHAVSQRPDAGVAPPESPSAPPVVAPGGNPPAASVFFADVNRHVPFASGQTLCEVAEQAGVAIDADCHVGVCGMDPVLVLDGGANLNPVGDLEARTLRSICGLAGPQHRLACMARVHGAVKVERVR